MYTVDKKEKCPRCIDGIVTTKHSPEICSCDYSHTITYPCRSGCIQGFTYTEVPLDDAIADLLSNNSKIRCMKW